MKLMNFVLAGAIATLGTTAAHAVTLPFDVELVDINGGSLATGTGSLTYDDTLLAFDSFEDISITGVNTLHVDPALAISMTLGGISFTESNDIDAPDFPSFNFFDGLLDFVDYEVVDGENGADLSSFGIDGFTLGGAVFDRLTGDLSFTAQELPSFAAIPLPAGGLLLVSALGMGAVVGRKRQA